MTMTAEKKPAKKAARKTAPQQVSRLETLGLSHLFQPSSAARAAAELLLTGEPMTRQELVRRTGVVETVVPRTVTALRKAGIQIDRVQDPTTKAATYTAVVPVVDKAPEGAFEFMASGTGHPAQVKLERMEGRGIEATVTLDSPLGTVTGTAPMSPLLATLASEGLPLCRVILLPGGKQEWMLGQLPNTLLVSDIEFI